jgi:hypothetical protein
MVMDKFKQHSRKIHGCKGVPGNAAPIGSARGRVRCDALPSSENIHDEIIVSVVTRCRGHSGGYEKEGSDGVKHIPVRSSQCCGSAYYSNPITCVAKTFECHCHNTITLFFSDLV